MSLKLRILCAVVALLCLLGWSCSGGGSHTSTEPPGFSPSGSARISGEVSDGSSSLRTGVGSSRILPAIPEGGPKAPVSPTLRDGRSLGSVGAADRSGSGYVVRVQGTAISATADVNGRFDLTGVPAGNQTLLFEGGGSSAPLPIDGIEPSEQIEIQVTVRGSAATLDNIQRSSDDDEGPVINVADLDLELAPDEWNLNYVHSSGTVASFIRGDGIAEIDLRSIEMSGDAPDVDPLPALSAELRGDHVRAEFPKDQVIDLLLDPEPGSVHMITISFTPKDSDERLELTGEIVIEDDDDDGNDDGGEDPGEDPLDDLTLQISPDRWNLNFRRSSGTVTVFIRGSGLSHIDLETVTLAGDNPEAEPIPAISPARLEGNHVRARFPKNQLIDLLDEPARGTTHIIIVSFDDDEGETHELTGEIRVVGNG